MGAPVFHTLKKKEDSVLLIPTAPGMWIHKCKLKPKWAGLEEVMRKNWKNVPPFSERRVKRVWERLRYCFHHLIPEGDIVLLDAPILALPIQSSPPDQTEDHGGDSTGILWLLAWPQLKESASLLRRTWRVVVKRMSFGVRPTWVRLNQSSNTY